MFILGALKVLGAWLFVGKLEMAGLKIVVGGGLIEVVGGRVDEGEILIDKVGVGLWLTEGEELTIGEADGDGEGLEIFLFKITSTFLVSITV